MTERIISPVALYTAINSGGDVHFNLINPKTNNRIKMITTDPDTGPLINVIWLIVQVRVLLRTNLRAQHPRRPSTRQGGLQRRDTFKEIAF